MDCAIMFKLVAPEQYGSSGKAMEHAQNKRLTFDNQHQTRLPTILCSNDTVACYNRIAYTALSLTLHRVGMRAGPVQSMIRTIQELKHHIRTALGDSVQYFDCGTLSLPVHGVG